MSAANYPEITSLFLWSLLCLTYCCFCILFELWCKKEDFIFLFFVGRKEKSQHVQAEKDPPLFYFLCNTVTYPSQLQQMKVNFYLFYTIQQTTTLIAVVGKVVVCFMGQILSFTL